MNRLFLVVIIPKQDSLISWKFHQTKNSKLSKDDIKYPREYVQIICKYYTKTVSLYKTYLGTRRFWYS